MNSEKPSMGPVVSEARHLNFGTLDALWSNGAAMVLPIQGEPSCRLQLDPKNGQITLLTPFEAPEPDLAKLKNVDFTISTSEALDLAEITVQVEGNLHGAYSLLATIADGVQVERLPLAAAVASGVASHRNVFAGRVALTIEKELGLLGELLFLEFLIHQVGAGPAIQAWQGPLSEEHDFIFEAVHIEVKTTSSERRQHLVHGLTQMVPLHGVPLSLLSVQLTRSSASSGRSLPQVIHLLRTISGGHQVALNERLLRVGWRDDDASLYATSWALRSQARAYDVNDDFPAMTSDRIAHVTPNYSLISNVSYRVDLSDFRHDNLPEPIAGFVELRKS